MSNTEIKVIRKDTFPTILSAVNKMVDTIKPTYGPASNKVIIDKLPYRMVVDDGVQIARDFELADPAENAVVKVVREVAVKTNDRVGDGTTSSLIMLQAILDQVSRKSKYDGRRVELELKKGLQEAREQLKAGAKQIETKEDLKKVAMVSFDDPEVAEMIADTYHKIGKQGVITIDKSPSTKTTVELTDGTKIDTGYISPYMINNPERMECVIENPYILITDYRLTENSDLMPLMERMAKENKRGLVIIAENVEQHALATLVINLPQVMNPETRKTGTFPSVAISLPKVDDRTTLLEDLAILTGAKMFTVAKGDKLETATLADLGRADKFICRREESIIVGPKGDKTSIAGAIDALKSAMQAEPIESNRKKLEWRLGMFSNSLAVIKVGATTDNEQKALKYKVEDAVNAVKVAYNGGVVCGSGIALAQIKTSSPILNEALKYPHRQLLENMGLEDNDDQMIGDTALNVVTGETGSFMEVGVVDPVEVLIAGVESAVSIASVLLTSSGMIVESPKETK